MLRGPHLHSDTRRVLNGARPITRRITDEPRRRINGRTKTLTDQSWTGYVERIAKLQARYPEKRVEEFTEADLFDFFVHDEDGARRKVGVKGWRESTVNGYIQAIVFAFTWAFEHDLIPTNPAARLRAEWGQPAIYHREGIWLEEFEIDKLIDARVGDDMVALRERVLCAWLVGTGLREFEASITWGLINGRGDYSQVRVLGKGNKYRTVQLTEHARGAIATWRTATIGLRGMEPDGDDPVFPVLRKHYGNRQGSFDWSVGLQEEGISGIVEKAGERIGRPELRPHDLRRTHAGYLDNKGVSITVIQEQLGHANIATTDRYLKSNPGRRAREFARAGI